MALTLKGTRGLLARGEVGRHFDRDGLYLVIDGPMSARWERRYQFQKQPRYYGIGPVKAFDLEEARAQNKLVSQQIAQGIDPLVAKRTRQAAQKAAAAVNIKIVTFRELGERFIADNQAGWKSASYGLQWKRSLERYVYPIIGGIDIKQIQKPDVLNVLKQRVVTDDGKSGKFWELRTVTSDKVRNRIELIVNYAMARGYRDQSFNPASWEMLKHVLPAKRRLATVVHYAAVPYIEVPAVMAELGRHEGVAAQALRFTILAAARTNETLGAVRSEIDLANKVWTIPAARMKPGKEHRVPLSDAAVELLQSLHTEKGNPYLFVGLRNEKLSTGAMAAVMKRIRRSESVHGFRSSFSTWAHERTSFSNHAIEISLAHSVGNEVERAYRRGDNVDKRRALMQQWAKFITATPVGKVGDNVIGIGGAR
jgi:integrase